MSDLRTVVNRVLNVFLTIIGAFLVLRIIFAFFAANAATPFVSWIYSVGQFLTYPFRGIFSDLSVPTTGGVVDITAFISLLAYGIIFSLLVALVNSIFQSAVFTRDRHVHAH